MDFSPPPPPPAETPPKDSPTEAAGTPTAAAPQTDQGQQLVSLGLCARLVVGIFMGKEKSMDR